MLKKIIIFCSCLLLGICAYSYYSFTYTKKTLIRSLAYTSELEANLNAYLLTHPDFVNEPITNQTFDLPPRYSPYNAPLRVLNINKRAGSKIAFINAQINPDNLKLLPFMTPKASPFIQIRLIIEDRDNIVKSCYSNLPKLYLPKGCTVYY